MDNQNLTSDENSEIFNRAADTYKAQVEASISFTGLPYDLFTRSKQELISCKSSEFGLRAGGKILNIGCGTGSLDGLLSELGFEVTGIDVSEQSIKKAKRANPNVRYDVFDGKHMPFPDETFDLCLAVCVYHHITPSNRLRLAQESLRVLKKGGVTSIIEHNPYNILTRIAVARCEFDRDAELLTRSSSNKLLRDSGAKDAMGQYFMAIPLNGNKFRRMEMQFSRMPIGAQYISYGYK